MTRAKLMQWGGVCGWFSKRVRNPRNGIQNRSPKEQRDLLVLLSQFVCSTPPVLRFYLAALDLYCVVLQVFL
jgi:hypothetical protein